MFKRTLDSSPSRQETALSRGASGRVGLRLTGGIMLLAFLVLLSLVATSPHSYVYDESFLVKDVHLLQQHGLNRTFLTSMTATPGPLYSLVHVAFEPLTKLEPVRMRMGNVLLLALVGGILAAWLKREGRSDYWVAGLSVLAVPMTWVVAGMALSEIAAMVFVTLSLYLQLRGLDALEQGRPVLALFVLSGLFLGIAVWGRQSYLLLCGVPVLLAFMNAKLRVAAAMHVVVVVSLVLPLVVVWRGLVPPSSHAVQGISVTHGLISLAYTGICIMLLAPHFLRIQIKWLAGLVVLAVAANVALDVLELFPLRSLVDIYVSTAKPSLYGKLCGALFLSCGAAFLLLALRAMWNNQKDLKYVAIYAGLLCVALSPTFVAHLYSSRYTAMALPYLILAAQYWRQWSPATVATRTIGAVIGSISLFGYFDF